jgi:hypothetical protein
MTALLPPQPWLDPVPPSPPEAAAWPLHDAAAWFMVPEMQDLVRELATRIRQSLGAPSGLDLKTALRLAAHDQAPRADARACRALLWRAEEELIADLRAGRRQMIARPGDAAAAYRWLAPELMRAWKPSAVPIEPGPLMIGSAVFHEPRIFMYAVDFERYGIEPIGAREPVARPAAPKGSSGKAGRKPEYHWEDVRPEAMRRFNAEWKSDAKPAQFLAGIIGRLIKERQGREPSQKACLNHAKAWLGRK